MRTDHTFVTRLDRERLESHLAAVAPSEPVARLRTLLAHARPVSSARVPPDVVTMNSRVVVRNERTNEADTYILAYPDYRGPRPVYVFSPLGSALLAAREGQHVTFNGATGPRSVVLEAIEYQPERSGELEL